MGSYEHAAALADSPDAADRLGFALLFLLWWNYFNPTISGEPADTDATTVGRSAFAYAHAAMVGGAILVAVAIELVIAHADGHVDIPLVLTLFGGTLLYLAGNAQYLAAKLGRIPTSRLVAAVPIVISGALIAVLRDSVTPHAAVAAAAAVLTGLAIASRRTLTPTSA